MTASRVHKTRIQEHLQEIKDAIAIGIEQRPATIGFHTSACAIDFLELYLHKTGKIPVGMQIKHEWFKRPKPGQKILPLTERHLLADFLHKKEIIELQYSLEERRNKLIYGNSTPPEIHQTLAAFEKLKQLLLELLKEAGEEIETPDG